MKRAWIFGDSHAAGSGIVSGNPAQEYLESYPCQLARTLGYQKTLNYSIAGHSNDAIFRWVTEQIDNMQPEDLVILCWTEQARTEIWSDEVQQWLYFVQTGQDDAKYQVWHSIIDTPNAMQGIIGPWPISASRQHQPYLQQWQQNLDQDLRACNLNFVKNVLAANATLRDHNITAMNIWSLSAVHHAVPDRFSGSLDRLWWPVGHTVFRNWALQQGYSEDSSFHLPMAAHTAFADYVYTEIKRTR